MQSIWSADFPKRSCSTVLHVFMMVTVSTCKKKRSTSERVRNFRERIRKNPEKFEAYKLKDKERKQQERRLFSTQKRAEEREKCMIRVQRHRLKRKLDLSSPVKEDAAFKTPQSLGKAVKKAKKALPFSPRKRKVILSKLAQEVGSKPTQILSRGNKRLPDETVLCVQRYFVLDSVSRQAPGIKDYVTVKSGDKKAKIQKRHLSYSLKETYALFKKDHPAIKISFSKFCALRPPNVKLSSMMPRNVCLCQYHDNVKLLCEAIHKEVPEIPPYSSDFVNNFVCSTEDEKCMSSACSKCPDWVEDVKSTAPLDEPIEWYQWERIAKTVPSKKGKPSKTKQKIEKVVKVGLVDEALTTLQKKMPAFLDHVFIKRKQLSFFEEKKANLSPDEAILQVDFAENYTCHQQDEIQAVHWNQEQVTVFPVFIWTSTSQESYAIISDERSHDKRSVAVYMSKVLSDFVKQKHPEVKTVHIFSDGPSSQFKNKYIVHLLYNLQESTGLCLKWNYFATSHGKGVVDGIGGTVKRAVWSAVATRKVPVVDSAKSFAETAVHVCKLSTKIFLVPKKEIKERYPSFNLENVSAIPGISKVHCIEPKEHGTVILRKYSTQDKGMVFHEIEHNETTSGDDDDDDVSSGITDDDEDNGGGDVDDDVSSGITDDNEDDGGGDVSDEDDDDISSGITDDEDDGGGDVGDDDDGDDDDDNDDGGGNVDDDDDQEDDVNESDEKGGKSESSQYVVQDEFPGEQHSLNNHKSTINQQQDVPLTNPKMEDQPTRTKDKLRSSINDVKPTVPASEEINHPSKLHIIHGLPQETRKFMNIVSAAGVFPKHYEPLLRAILEGIVTVAGGTTMLDKSDVASLYGHNTKHEENFLTNFCIDEYLKLIAAESATRGTKVVSLAWEQFAKWNTKSAQAINLNQLLKQDLAFVPCNSANHWFLLCVLPQQKQILVLDSLAGNYTKPAAKKAVAKMWKFLTMEDNTLDHSQWEFYTNTPSDIPQQNNGHDCGVYVCLYVRCLSLLYLLPIDLNAFRKQMIIELHQQKIGDVNLPDIEKHCYYAVDYIKSFYVGRVLSISQDQSIISFKFLHSVGSKLYDWPKRDDIDNIHKTCVFYGPVTLSGIGPFTVKEQVEKVHQCLKKYVKL